MKKKNRLLLGLGLLAAFTAWTLLLGYIDVRAIGPRGSAVGFAGLNGWFHKITGVHFLLYHITDWAGLVPIAVCLCFAILGLCQWIKRKNILKVDPDILILGGFYLLTMGAYILFEYITVNYRPVLIAGYLETSYPSSTTLLVLCVMPATMLQLRRRIERPVLRSVILWTIGIFTVFMVLGRLISGVHWLSDILGGLLLSGGLVLLYHAAAES